MASRDRPDERDESEDPLEEIAECDDVIARLGDPSEPELREEVADALVRKAGALGELGRSDEELAVYDEVVARFGDDQAPGVRAQVAYALVNQGIALADLERDEEAVAAYDEVVARFGVASQPEIQEEVARALVWKGDSIGRLSAGDDELALYDLVVARFGETTEPEIQEEVARALAWKADALAELERHEEALAICDDVIRRFGSARAGSELREQIAAALLTKGQALSALKRTDEELGAYDEVAARFGKDDHPDVLAAVAEALVNKADALAELERFDDALAVVDAVYDRFGGATELDLEDQIIRALLRKVRVLGRLKRYEPMPALCDEIIARAEEDDDDPEAIARALENKGFALRRLQRGKEAIAAYAEIVTRFGDAAEPELREFIVDALFRQGQVLAELERAVEALAAYEALIVRFSDDPTFHTDAARALFNRSLLLHGLQRFDDAIADVDELLALVGDATDRELAELVVYALNVRGSSLSSLGRNEEAVVVYDSALGTYDRLAERVDTEISPRLRTTAARALSGKLYALYQLGREKDWIAAVDSLVSRFGSASEKEVREEVVRAILDKSGVLWRLDRADEAASLPDTVFAIYGRATDHERHGSAEVPTLDEKAEARLAALLASTLVSDCWNWFASPRDDPRSLSLMAERALGLYRRTAPFVDALAANRDFDSPRFAAVLLVRSIADAYALLSRAWPEQERPQVFLLPTRARVEWSIRAASLDEWAQDLGHPLDVDESADDDEEIPDEIHLDAPSGDFTSAFVKTIQVYEIVAAVRDSFAASATLCSERFRVPAIRYIAYAHSWMARLGEREPDAAAAALAMLLFAQAYFVATSTTTPRDEWFPSKELLRDFLVASEALRWLENEEVVLPDWLT